MSETNWWNALWSNAGQRFDLNGDWSMLTIVLATLLFTAAIAIRASAVRKHRRQPQSETSFGLGWLVPLTAVALLVIAPVLLYFARGGSPQHEEHPDDADLGQPTELIHTFPHDADAHAVVPSAERPAWVDAMPFDEGPRRLIVVQGQQFPEKARARQDALEAAVEVVRKDAAASRQLTGEWQLDAALVQTHAVKDTYVEPIKRSTGVNDFYVYRAYHLVELSPEVEEVAFTSWRGQIVEHRLWILGGLFGFVTLLTGTTAAYLRLDQLTKGNYRNRLKFASLSLLAAGGLGLAALLPLA